MKTHSTGQMATTDRNGTEYMVHYELTQDRLKITDIKHRGESIRAIADPSEIDSMEVKLLRRLSGAEY